MDERGVVQQAGAGLLDGQSALQADPDLVGELDELLDGELEEVILRDLTGGFVMGCDGSATSVYSSPSSFPPAHSSSMAAALSSKSKPSGAASSVRIPSARAHW